MKSRFQPMLLCLALTAASFGALAQPAAGAGQADTERHGHMREHMQERMAQRAADLKAKLKLSPEQESGWKDFTAAMKPPAQPHMPTRGEMAKLNTPERLDRMRELRKQHEAEFDKRDAATRTFYGSLNADQKKIFDDNTAHPLHGGGSGAPHSH